MGDAEDIVEIQNVEIIRDMGWALFCRVGMKIRFIPHLLLRAGSVRQAGERGMMVMPNWLAIGLGLP
jgi:hypothetical protein